MKRHGHCPLCKSSNTLRIVYGLIREPIPGAIPGYCAQSPDSPLWKCGACGFAWRDRDENGRFSKPVEARRRTAAR